MPNADNFNRRLINLAVFLALSTGAAVPQVTEFSAPVTKISDGNTIQVLHEGVSKRIRLFGIDCPEIDQPFGTTAKKFISDLALGKTVKVRVRDVDHQRVVADITLPDARMLNQELVRAGLAWWYGITSKADAELHRLEIEARVAKRGLWIDRNPVPPWTWRREKTDTSVEVSQ
jgi:micrococcal nuclease